MVACRGRRPRRPVAPLEGSSRAAGEGWPGGQKSAPNHPSVTCGDSSPPRGAFRRTYGNMILASLEGSQNGASRTPPPTNDQKLAINNRNCEPFNRRVLAPGRGQCVRSWILKGALAKRSCAARTQAPLSRAPRLGSSGTFLVLFWSQKSTPVG